MMKPRNAELFLALASASAGGIIAAAAAGDGFHSLLGWILYGVSAAFFLTTSFVYWFIWKTQDSERAEIAELVGDWEFESTTRASRKKAKGLIVFDASQGKLSGRGPVYGENDDLIAEVKSQACHYDGRWLTMVYMYSSQDDNGKQSAHQCILNAFVKKPREEIKGMWRQLDWDGDGGAGGDICLVRKPTGSR